MDRLVAKKSLKNAFSGYLDDVNGAYRTDYTSAAQAYAANPSGIISDRRGNGTNDMYLSAFLSIAYHFNFKKKNFQAPMVYMGHTTPTPLAYDNDAEQPDEALPSTIKKTPVNPQNANPAPAVSNPVTPPAARLQENDVNTAASRQTVDINLRVIVEGGRAVVDTVSIPLNSSKPQVNRLAPAGTKTMPDTLSRTSRVPNTDVIYKNITPGQTDTLTRITNSHTAVPGDNSLQSEFRQMRRELDSLKAVQRVPVNTQRNLVPGTIPRGNNPDSAALYQNQARVQDTDDARMSALQQEVQQLRTDLQKERRLNNNAPAPTPNVIIKNTPPLESGRRVNTGLAVGVPLLQEKNYNKEDMNALRTEVNTIQAQLNQLNAQKKIEKDTIINARIDSLVNLINRIESLDKAQATTPVSADNNTPQSNDVLTDQLIDSLKLQVASLNQSLVSMESKMDREIDSLATIAPLSALGSTVVYYNMNAAELNSEDKQRLSILGQKLKSDPAVLLHIKGFTDQTGNAAYNLALSRKRAENVKSYFVNQVGIKPEQVLINYFGQQKASSGKDNPTDRRVELELFRN